LKKKNNMPKIIPSLLVTNETDFESQIKSVTGLVDMIQVDLADGKFVPNTTWPYQEPQKAQKHLENIDFELHLMVEEPLKIIKQWINHKRLKRILVHIESTNDIESILSEIKMFHKEAGIVLNPTTSIYDAEPYFDKIDSLMLMGVKPGFQGQAFIPSTIDKIKKVKEINKNVFIEIDGGVNKLTITQIARAGADVICPGSAVFKGDNIENNITDLTNLLTA